MSPLFWSSATPYRVELDDATHSFLLSTSEDAGNIETGGILIGTYSDDGLLARICRAVGPPKGSEATPNRFVRSESGLAGILKQHWDEHEYYLGEWHSHPMGAGVPSHQDKRQMLTISTDAAYCCPKPILVVVGGSIPRQINVWVLDAGELLLLQESNLGTERGASCPT